MGATRKASELYGKLKQVSHERQDYYAGIPLDEQYEKIDDILSDMQAYRRNIDILIENDNRDYAEKETVTFNTFIDKFSQFVGDDDEDLFEEPDSDPDLEDSIPLDSLGVPDSLPISEQ